MGTNLWRKTVLILILIKNFWTLRCCSILRGNIGPCGDNQDFVTYDLLNCCWLLLLLLLVQQVIILGLQWIWPCVHRFVDLLKWVSVLSNNLGLFIHRFNSQTYFLMPKKYGEQVILYFFSCLWHRVIVGHEDKLINFLTLRQQNPSLKFFNYFFFCWET